MDEIVLRFATRADTEAVTCLVAEAFAIYTPKIGKPPAPVFYDYGALIETGLVSVAIAGAEVLGMVYLYAQDGGTAMLDVLAVAEAAQGRGLARLLITRAEEQARRMGAQRIDVYTNVVMEGPLVLYPKLGFSETHRGESDGYQRVHFSKEL
ncbi:GNAT family N-acetyltransferase [Celeribacter baekdonensis]|uniref:Acetyltransferase-like protein n=1 Tax=Celeribacter baekdonensis B30 TaxID=1208323 RepID=K2IIS7_9RHOB|nr:GNAT family N-acetyltransferase [Celeribacter baekdonensis]EKE70041.1 acetyltransferase-like protein [Celeribacter baekdonensis B30]